MVVRGATAPSSSSGGDSSTPPAVRASSPRRACADHPVAYVNVNLTSWSQYILDTAGVQTRCGRLRSRDDRSRALPTVHQGPRRVRRRRRPVVPPGGGAGCPRGTGRPRAGDRRRSTGVGSDLGRDRNPLRGVEAGRPTTLPTPGRGCQPPRTHPTGEGFGQGQAPEERGVQVPLTCMSQGTAPRRRGRQPGCTTWSITTSSPIGRSSPTTPCAV